MAAADRPAECERRASTILPLAGLTLLLFLLTARQVYDLDHGFYVAAGREIFAHGIPRTEWYLPALPDRPFASLWLLSAPIFGAAWDLLGPAWLVALKVGCYGGAFLLAAWAAIRRGAQPWVAAMLTAVFAAAVSTRFVERPGMFSALLMGVVVCLMNSSERWREEWRDAALFAVLCFWSLLHAEWILGIGVAAVLRLRGAPDRKRLTGLHGLAHDLRDRDRGLGTAIWLVAWLAVPTAIFAAFHPAGIGALLAPFGFLTGGSGIPVQEYAAAGWATMPGAVLLLAAMAAGAVAMARRGLMQEALLLAAFVVLSLVIRRAILPAAIVAVPLLAPLLPHRLDGWKGIAFGFLVGAVAVAGQYALSPWYRLGFALDETLDTRGVGAELDAFPQREGTVLAEFGWSSLLLANPGVVRQGVVMDGRQEAYPHDYFARVYTPCFRPGPGWVQALAAADVAFYIEPQRVRSGGDDLIPALQAAGWRLVAWDNSSRLVVRADVADRHGLAALRVDPSHLEMWEKAPPAERASAIAEVRARTEALEAAGLPSTLGRLALAKLEMWDGNPDAAEAELNLAPTAKRFASYRALRARILMLQGRVEEAAE